MADSCLLRFSIVVVPCTTHLGRFRWELQRDDAAAVLSQNSYLSESEALHDAAEEMVRLHLDRSLGGAC
jgi:hypothetical protein